MNLLPPDVSLQDEGFGQPERQLKVSLAAYGDLPSRLDALAVDDWVTRLTVFIVVIIMSISSVAFLGALAASFSFLTGHSFCASSCRALFLIGSEHCRPFTSDRRKSAGPRCFPYCAVFLHRLVWWVPCSPVCELGFSRRDRADEVEEEPKSARHGSRAWPSKEWQGLSLVGSVPLVQWLQGTLRRAKGPHIGAETGVPDLC